jgi:hypothetical protein
MQTEVPTKSSVLLQLQVDTAGHVAVQTGRKDATMLTKAQNNTLQGATVR